jgi:hypothetical protein
MAPLQAPFRAEIITRADETVIIELFGELDLVSMATFEGTLAAALSRRPRRVIFDISAAQFISVQGFAAIGRCSQVVESVTVHYKNWLAEGVLRTLGYEQVACVETGSTPRGAR